MKACSSNWRVRLTRGSSFSWSLIVDNIKAPDVFGGDRFGNASRMGNGITNNRLMLVRAQFALIYIDISKKASADLINQHLLLSVVLDDERQSFDG